MTHQNDSNMLLEFDLDKLRNNSKSKHAVAMDRALGSVQKIRMEQVLYLIQHMFIPMKKSHKDYFNYGYSHAMYVNNVQYSEEELDYGSFNPTYIQYDHATGTIGPDDTLQYHTDDDTYKRLTDTGITDKHSHSERLQSILELAEITNEIQEKCINRLQEVCTAYPSALYDAMEMIGYDYTMTVNQLIKIIYMHVMVSKGNANMCYMEGGTKVFDFNWLDVSKVKHLDFVFYRDLITPNNKTSDKVNFLVDKWDVSKVKSMTYMFAGQPYFNCDLSLWKPKNCKDFTHMFDRCLSLNQDFSSWGSYFTSGCDISYMFVGCKAQKTPILGWKLRDVAMYGLFGNWASHSYYRHEMDCGPNERELQETAGYSVLSIIKMINTWDVQRTGNPNSTYTSGANLFTYQKYASYYVPVKSYIYQWNDKIPVLYPKEIFPDWFVNSPEVKDVWDQYESEDVLLVQETVQEFFNIKNANQLYEFDLDKLKNMKRKTAADAHNDAVKSLAMQSLEKCSIYYNNNRKGQEYLVWSPYPNVFDYAEWLQLPLQEKKSLWGEAVSNLTYLVHFSGEMFTAWLDRHPGIDMNLSKTLLIQQVIFFIQETADNCPEILKEISDIYDPGTHTVDLNWMDVSDMTSMKYLFRLDLFTEKYFSPDPNSDTDIFANIRSMMNFKVDKWDVSSCQNMSFMFAGLTKFDCDLSGWDVSSVKDTGSMFKDCRSFSGNLKAWANKLGSVTNLAHMFHGCGMSNPDLRGWNLSSLTSRFGEWFGEIAKMFEDVDADTMINKIQPQLRTWKISGKKAYVNLALIYGNGDTFAPTGRNLTVGMPKEKGKYVSTSVWLGKVK